MKKKYGNRTWKETKKRNKFNPNHKFIDSEIKKFLKAGGKIKKTEYLPDKEPGSDYEAVDDFLSGE